MAPWLIYVTVCVATAPPLTCARPNQVAELPYASGGAPREQTIRLGERRRGAVVAASDRAQALLLGPGSQKLTQLRCRPIFAGKSALTVNRVFSPLSPHEFVAAPRG